MFTVMYRICSIPQKRSKKSRIRFYSWSIKFERKANHPHPGKSSIYLTIAHFSFKLKKVHRPSWFNFNWEFNSQENKNGSISSNIGRITCFTAKLNLSQHSYSSFERSSCSQQSWTTALTGQYWLTDKSMWRNRNNK